jgi:hypothetical protein
LNLEKWDKRVHDYFDYFSYAHIDAYRNPGGKPALINELHPGNDIMAAKPNHPITLGYLDSIITNVWAPYDRRPLEF